MAQPQQFGLNIAAISDPTIQQAIRILVDRINQLQQRLENPLSGTIGVQDQRPVLTKKDKGTIFNSTDFNRLFIWDGSQWNDYPGQAARFSTTFIAPPQTPAPQQGWAPANGATVKISTARGTTQNVTVPVIPNFGGLRAWIRI